MNGNERVSLASSHGSVASTCEVSFAPSAAIRRNPFPSGLGDTYAGKKITRAFSQSDISGLHFETQSCFTVLAGAKCFVYTIQPWRIAD